MVQQVQHEGNHITALLSFNDLLQLAGYTAVEYCGGPSMVFRMGRQDADHHEVSETAIATSGAHENAV